MPALFYLLALAVFAQGTSEFVLAGLLPGIAGDLDVSLGQAGLLTAAFAVGMIIGAPTMAAVTRRLSPRRTLTGFLLLFIIMHVIAALTGSFVVLLVSRIIAAVANAGFLAVALSTVSRIVAPGRQARALSVILGGTTVALVVGVPAGAFVGGAVGWRVTLAAIAVACLPALVAVLLATPVRPAGGGDGEPGTLRAELSVLRHRPVQLFATLAVLVNAATFCSFTYLAVVADDSAGLSGAQVPVLLALFGTGAFAGVALTCSLADAHWRLLVAVAGPLLVVGWIVFGVGAGSLAAVWVMAPVMGILSFTLGSTLITRIIATAQDAPTMAGSFATVALNVGAVLGPVAGGVAVDAVGPRGPLVTSAVFALVAVLVWAAFSRGGRRPASR